MLHSQRIVFVGGNFLFREDSKLMRQVEAASRYRVEKMTKTAQLGR